MAAMVQTSATDYTDPEAPPDCPTCHTLAHRRRAARERRDLSAVSDCNVLIRKHPEHPHAPEAH
ncbi:hypothetical protein ABT160_02870 [Streptomyces sp. NPDC001941]|uniref:hypothetical protein n=1 Tax=Streptomyces sp. NPDC001941 TaxID=3154659 RepID=UPI00331A6419